MGRLLVVVAALGCREERADPFDLEPDASVEEDAAAETDAAPDAQVLPSGCPVPARLTPDDLPSGYLAPVPVRYVRTTDGDTAHFQFPSSGEEIVRFLYVNTEESHGDATTSFGVWTSTQVQSYLESASSLVVAPREDPDNPGHVEVDAFDRWLALVFANGELFQTRVVREGLSAYYTAFDCAPSPIHNALLYAEAEANANDRGIWQPGHPTDYEAVLNDWIGRDTCRPNPYDAPYCP